MSTELPIEKAAERGAPSLVWRAGQARRLEMILAAAGSRVRGAVLEDGCGVGMYVERLQALGGRVIGLEIELPRLVDAAGRLGTQNDTYVCAAGEGLPFASSQFDLVLSHEVLEHVRDDRAAVCEIVRVLKPGGRLVLFCPNRGYPFETHGIYWKGKYRFGNIPLVNYLPTRWRNALAPHVRIYTRRSVAQLFEGLPVRCIERRIIFGAYDNLIARFGAAGRLLRVLLQALERTPLQFFGLSHFWVVEKTPPYKSAEQ